MVTGHSSIQIVIAWGNLLLIYLHWWTFFQRISLLTGLLKVRYRCLCSILGRIWMWLELQRIISCSLIGWYILILLSTRLLLLDHFWGKKVGLELLLLQSLAEFKSAWLVMTNLRRAWDRLDHLFSQSLSLRQSCCLYRCYLAGAVIQGLAKTSISCELDLIALILKHILVWKGVIIFSHSFRSLLVS